MVPNVPVQFKWRFPDYVTVSLVIVKHIIQNISDLLNIFLHNLFAIIDRELHRPEFTNLLWVLRMRYFFPCVAISEPDELFRCDIISLFHLSILSLFEVFSHLISDLLLKLKIHFWNENCLVKVRSAHWAIISDCFLAAQAEHMSAMREDWLNTQFPAYRALVVFSFGFNKLVVLSLDYGLYFPD